MSQQMTSNQRFQLPDPQLRQAFDAIAQVLRKEADERLTARIYNKLCDMLPGVTLPMSRPEFFSACGMTYTRVEG